MFDGGVNPVHYSLEVNMSPMRAFRYFSLAFLLIPLILYGVFGFHTKFYVADYNVSWIFKILTLVQVLFFYAMKDVLYSVEAQYNGQFITTGSTATTRLDI